MFFSLTDKLNQSEDLYKILEEKLELYSMDKQLVSLFIDEDRELLGRAWFLYNNRNYSKAIKLAVIEGTYNYLVAQVDCLKDLHFEIAGILNLEAREQLFEAYADYKLEVPETTRLLLQYPL